MAVAQDHQAVTSFDDWYVDREEDSYGCLTYRQLADVASKVNLMYLDYKREMDSRVAKFYKLEQMADGEVVSKKNDLPNVSSGETAGIVRRISRNLVQHTPNLELLSEHDDESVSGIFARHILLTKIVGSDEYSNDMQQNLFASVKTAFTLGFDCVIPVLTQDAAKSWYVKYDTIHYRDVFPEPGARDIRDATSVFIRRYMTRGEIKQIIRDQVAGWDIAALRTLLKSQAPTRHTESVSQFDRRHHASPEGYEIITWYTDSGDPFLTFSPFTKDLLRIERNVHPANNHPVHFLVLEKDSAQPLGKSQVELLFGRQEFQDLMLNGMMKLWYRNINPAIIGYGTVNAALNLSPGKYNEIQNPNARIEPFSVENQTMLQAPSIMQNNLGSMVNLVGAADQQMATQAGNGMSATPQGVEAQQAMVDITTNNYQKAIESFFSHYCADALTRYFQELKGITKVKPSADARRKLINAGIPVEEFDDKGELKVDYSLLATNYYVRCVPGSLVEMEDEKQIRLLNELLVPLSQALPAIAQSQDAAALANASAAMQFIVRKQIELSGSTHSTELKEILRDGPAAIHRQQEDARMALEQSMSDISTENDRAMDAMAQNQSQMSDRMATVEEALGAIMQHLGVSNNASAPEQPQMPAA